MLITFENNYTGLHHVAVFESIPAFLPAACRLAPDPGFGWRVSESGLGVWVLEDLGVWVLEDAAARVQLCYLRTCKSALLFTFDTGGPHVSLRFLLELDRYTLLDPIADERRRQTSPRRHALLQPACVHNWRGFEHRFRLTMC